MQTLQVYTLCNILENAGPEHWDTWRPLVVETARRVLEYTAGTLVMPMTALVESYWRETSDRLAGHGIIVFGSVSRRQGLFCPRRGRY